MDYERHHETLPGDISIDVMNPKFNEDGTIILSPTIDFHRKLFEKYNVGDQVRIGSNSNPTKFAKCIIVSKGEVIVIKPLD
jgi:hypothetical protein